jgi:AraC-like DNA-binding protein
MSLGAVLRLPTAAPRTVPFAPSEEHETLRELVAGRVRADGHTPTAVPSVCIYRWSQPTTFTKAPAFGVTLGVVLSGAKDVRIAGGVVRSEPSRFIVITRDTEFEVAAVEASPEQPYLGLSLCFSPESVAKALLALSEAGGETTKETLPVFVTASDPLVLAALTRLVRAIDDPLERQVLVPLAEGEILFRLLRSDAAAAVRSAVSRDADAVRILSAMEFIRKESQRPLSVEAIARQVAMSPSHFAHRFRAVARVSPMRFLREVRLENARTLLADPTARAGEVAAKVGFESASHFTREFKRRYGAAPIAYVQPARARRS